MAIAVGAVESADVVLTRAVSNASEHVLDQLRIGSISVIVASFASALRRALLQGLANPETLGGAFFC